MKGMRGRQIEGRRREGCTRAEEVNEERGGGASSIDLQEEVTKSETKEERVQG